MLDSGESGADAVADEVKAWQSRPREPEYGLLFPDGLYIEMRHEGRAENRGITVPIRSRTRGSLLTSEASLKKHQANKPEGNKGWCCRLRGRYRSGSEGGRSTICPDYVIRRIKGRGVLHVTANTGETNDPSRITQVGRKVQL